ncbi:MAG: hypothetical protein CMH26_06860 [Micavibrio sp.]|nr:hypothetical protein [Micavibrio sp.]|tara:strand:- start:282 stop:614 length:333 start_codon:yes stop_codon:yes gene_type:complete
MADDRLPTGLLVDAVLAPLNAKGIFYYIAQKGNHASGLLLVKLNGLKGQVKLITQQRNFMSDEIEWIDALGQELVDEPKADEYIRRQCDIDPDLWVIEIEGEAMSNPFDV